MNKDKEYTLTTSSDSSPFTDCFGVFLLHFFGKLNTIGESKYLLADRIAKGLYEYKSIRENGNNIDRDKNFLQLFAFSLSAIHLLEAKDRFPFEDLVNCILPNDMGNFLDDIQVKDGVPQSGNIAMAIAVVAIYARDFLGCNVGGLIDDWVSIHIDSMNEWGFWSDNKKKHLQFQNGFHQYEILEYLGVDNPKIEKAINLIHQTADHRGQFSLYFGGSGCYDYDAVSIITAQGRNLSQIDKDLLIKTMSTILSEQNLDGGFSESQWMRPRSIKSIYSGLGHILSAKGDLRQERMNYFIALQSPKHNRLHTHWTRYSRRWSESNLWDTWLRLQTIARIDIAFAGNNSSEWNFINFPGIGYHQSARKEL